MTIENDVLREDLRAWMRSPALGMSNYSTDPVIQRRVGRMLANFSEQHSVRAQEKGAVRTGLPSKP